MSELWWVGDRGEVSVDGEVKKQIGGKVRDWEGQRWGCGGGYVGQWEWELEELRGAVVWRWGRECGYAGQVLFAIPINNSLDQLVSLTQPMKKVYLFLNDRIFLKFFNVLLTLGHTWHACIDGDSRALPTKINWQSTLMWLHNRSLLILFFFLYYFFKLAIF